ncbi:2-iminobutanoate/2-iminopropanoate deaminase-like isoform X4 [Dreissena polymorpha]|uniref:2-iminobutanoate/2-iminopropanoate deaminase-like isoform X4 n=1 Tax=Dreissena polymorpha TaxID=45954 RepID=UPI0022654F1F|nr:2-iminobutanoate/2-iminopropanoate deaminase-like isoform X4 [Dreissena polymorpha]
MSRMASVVRKIIKTTKAPGAVGPYSQAVLVNHTLYITGQIGLDVNTGTIVPGGVVAECEQVLKNMGVILAEAGSDYSKVVKCTVLLDDIGNFNAVNEVYLKFFTTDKLPARACYAVKDLFRGAKVAIEAVAIVGDVKDE